MTGWVRPVGLVSVTVCVLCLAGCGGSGGYDTMLATNENDSQDDQDHRATVSSAQSSTGATSPADSSSASSAPVAPVAGQQPFWANAQVPEVVPYVEEEEEEEEPEVDNRAPAPPLPSNFFVEDQPKTSQSQVPSSSSIPTAPDSSPSAATTPSQMPIDSRPGSTPGRPNPFGFPSGFSGHNHGGNQPSSAAPTGATTVPKVRLSSAVALAQSLPTGTAMGFSMDYVFLSEFLPNARYAWIIQPPRGNAVAMEVRLKQQGSLSHFVTQWGPIEGTYKLQLVVMDSKGVPRPMSNAIDAFYAY